MKKILAIGLLFMTFGCATSTKCLTESCVIISCPDSDRLIMSIPYSQEDWDKIRKRGDSWTATFRCERKGDRQ